MMHKIIGKALYGFVKACESLSRFLAKLGSK